MSANRKKKLEKRAAKEQRQEASRKQAKRELDDACPVRFYSDGNTVAIQPKPDAIPPEPTEALRNAPQHIRIGSAIIDKGSVPWWILYLRWVAENEGPLVVGSSLRGIAEAYIRAGFIPPEDATALFRSRAG